MILLLELFQPTGAICLQVAVGVTHGRSEESGLISDDGIAEWQTLSLVVPRPVCKRPFDVWKLALRSFDR
jgi:hypothetical protein